MKKIFLILLFIAAGSAQLSAQNQYTQARPATNLFGYAYKDSNNTFTGTQTFNIITANTGNITTINATNVNAVNVAVSGTLSITKGTGTTSAGSVTINKQSGVITHTWNIAPSAIGPSIETITVNDSYVTTASEITFSIQDANGLEVGLDLGLTTFGTPSFCIGAVSLGSFTIIAFNPSPVQNFTDLTKIHFTIN